MGPGEPCEGQQIQEQSLGDGGIECSLAEKTVLVLVDGKVAVWICPVHGSPGTSIAGHRSALTANFIAALEPCFGSWETPSYKTQS